jgi:hypothetical protein
MGFKIVSALGTYGPRRGLEGPFQFASGRILYYDTREGAYWDPRTDFYVPKDEIAALHMDLMDLIRSG